jgi:hypothetical protein
MPGPLSSWDLGDLMARALSSGWRANPRAPKLSAEDLSAIASVSVATGSAALLWNRARTLDLAQHEDLQAAYRTHMLNAAIHEIQVRDIFDRMRAAGVCPILFKGWALARLYPDPGLRPYGDIDLWLPPAQFEKASRALPSGQNMYCVELHTSFYRQYERSLEDVMNRSQVLPLDGVDVRIPCAEDHLRFICLHFLFHGGWRPLWLCDVALMIESRAADFDWDRCLSGKRKYADWIACVIGLAHQLLGADVSGTPVERRARDLPGWLAPAVLRQWGEGSGMSHAENLSFSLSRRLLRPSSLHEALKEHWRNPIQASVEMNSWFSNAPRGPLQFAAAFLRVPDLARHFGREIRRS